MTDLPYHHDWETRFETSLGLQVKWFGRWGGDPDWSIEPSRLASDLICFFYLKDGSCTPEINGVAVPLKPGEMLVWRGGDVFSATQDPGRPQTSLSACLSLSRDDATNVLLRHSNPLRWKRQTWLPRALPRKSDFFMFLAQTIHSPRRIPALGFPCPGSRW